MLPCLCSVIDHRRRQNVVRTSVTHSAITLCATFRFLPHFEVNSNKLLNRRRATWNLYLLGSYLNWRNISLERIWRNKETQVTVELRSLSNLSTPFDTVCLFDGSNKLSIHLLYLLVSTNAVIGQFSGPYSPVRPAKILELILSQNCFVIYRQLFLTLIASKNWKLFFNSKLCIKAC